MSIWLREPSSFAGLDRRIAWAIAALLAVVLAASLATPPTPVAAASGAPEKRAEERADLILYEAIVERVRLGDPYYSATAEELRAGNYPLRPFVAFRLPTLAWMQAAISLPAATLLLWALIAATVVTWALVFRRAFSRGPPAAIATLLLLGGIALFGQRELVIFHEAWAAVLIALAIGLRGLDLTFASVSVALAAVLVRETALPLLIVMGGLALLERQWREALAWGAAVGAFAIALTLHAGAVAAATSPADLASPGWSSLGGWRFALTAMRLTTVTRFAPEWLGALLVVLMLFGWAAWRAPLAHRALGVLLAYVFVLCLFGRPDNFYWAMLVAPLLPVGLAFALPGIADLAASTLGRSERNSPAQ